MTRLFLFQAEGHQGEASLPTAAGPSTRVVPELIGEPTKRALVLRRWFSNRDRSPSRVVLCRRPRRSSSTPVLMGELPHECTHSSPKIRNRHPGEVFPLSQIPGLPGVKCLFQLDYDSFLAPRCQCFSFPFSSSYTPFVFVANHSAAQGQGGQEDFSYCLTKKHLRSFFYLSEPLSACSSVLQQLRAPSRGPRTLPPRPFAFRVARLGPGSTNLPGTLRLRSVPTEKAMSHWIINFFIAIYLCL